MIIFSSEHNLLEQLDSHEGLLNLCASKQLSFEEFLEKYDNFYFRKALDGHESDQEEQALLQKHAQRVNLHKIVALDILNNLCSEADAKKPDYVNAGRFGREVALRKIQGLFENGA